jgi:hypothetical protein
MMYGRIVGPKRREITEDGENPFLVSAWVVV